MRWVFSVPDSFSCSLSQPFSYLSASFVRNAQKKGGGGDDDEDDPSERGVVYVGHVPYGFFEDQMKGFFQQFGEVKRLRLARNKKVRAAPPKGSVRCDATRCDRRHGCSGDAHLLHRAGLRVFSRLFPIPSCSSVLLDVRLHAWVRGCVGACL